MKRALFMNELPKFEYLLRLFQLTRIYKILRNFSKFSAHQQIFHWCCHSLGKLVLSVLLLNKKTLMGKLNSFFD